MILLVHDSGAERRLIYNVCCQDYWKQLSIVWLSFLKELYFFCYVICDRLWENCSNFWYAHAQTILETRKKLVPREDGC